MKWVKWSQNDAHCVSPFVQKYRTSLFLCKVTKAITRPCLFEGIGNPVPAHEVLYSPRTRAAPGARAMGCGGEVPDVQHPTQPSQRKPALRVQGLHRAQRWHSGSTALLNAPGTQAPLTTFAILTSSLTMPADNPPSMLAMGLCPLGSLQRPSMPSPPSTCGFPTHRPLLVATDHGDSIGHRRSRCWQPES